MQNVNTCPVDRLKFRHIDVYTSITGEPVRTVSICQINGLLIIAWKNLNFVHFVGGSSLFNFGPCFQGNTGAVQALNTVEPRITGFCPLTFVERSSFFCVGIVLC